MPVRTCPRCGNHQYFITDAVNPMLVHLMCRTCSFTEPFLPKTSEEAMVLETNFRSGSSASGASSGITIDNPYTLSDPTLPHFRGPKAPACTKCPADADPELRDVLYIKTDPVNLKFQYICIRCKNQWGN